MEAIELLTEVRLARFEIANRSNDDGIFGGDIQNPLVVFQPWTGFYLDCAYYAEGRRDFAVPVRHCRLIQDCIALVWPRNSLRARRVEQMNMRIYDRYGCRLCSDIRERYRTYGFEKSSSVHVGIVSFAKMPALRTYFTATVMLCWVFVLFPMVSTTG